MTCAHARMRTHIIHCTAVYVHTPCDTLYMQHIHTHKDKLAHIHTHPLVRTRTYTDTHSTHISKLKRRRGEVEEEEEVGGEQILSTPLLRPLF